MYNAVEEKCFAFAIQVVKLSRHLQSEKNEYILSKQILRCGTSIGANVAEAQQAQSKADFISKMNIAQDYNNYRREATPSFSIPHSQFSIFRW